MNINHRFNVSLLLALFLGFFTVPVSAQADDGPRTWPVVAEGTDLSNWQPWRVKHVVLDRGWEFYWQKFLSQADIDAGEQQGVLTTIQRRSWVSNPAVNLPVHGFGTYRLHLRLPEDNEPFALRLGIIENAARIFWNGKLLASYGEPGTTKGLSVPGLGLTAIQLPIGSREGDLLIQVANFEDVSSGFVDQPLIGTLDDIQREINVRFMIAVLAAGFCFGMAIFHILRTLVRGPDVASVQFSLVCLAVTIRFLTSDPMPLSALLPALGWQGLMIINYLTYTTLVVGFTYFCTSLFPGPLDRFLRWFSLAGSLLYSLVIIIYPSVVWMDNLVWYQLFSLCVGVLIFVVFISALVKKREGSVLFSIGFLVLFVSSAFDILTLVIHLNFPAVSSFGIVVFIVIEALVMVQQGWVAQCRNEVLSCELQDINYSQARFLPGDLMNRIGKELVTKLEVGDHLSGRMSVVCLSFGPKFQLDAGQNPLERVELSNRLHAEFAPVVRRHGGFVTNYSFDRMWALFPGQPLDAIRCSYEILQLSKHIVAEKPGIMEPGIGVHFGDLAFGLLGESERMNAGFFGEEDRITSHLTELCAHFGVQVLVTKPVLEHVAELHEHQYRRVGGVVTSGETIPVYDFFDMDAKDIWRAKRVTRMSLARALRFVSMGHPGEARSLLEQVLKVNPSDKVALYYLKMVS